MFQQQRQHPFLPGRCARAACKTTKRFRAQKLLSQVTGVIRRQLECTRLEIDKTLTGCLFEDRNGRVYRVEETAKGAKLVLQ